MACVEKLWIAIRKRLTDQMEREKDCNARSETFAQVFFYHRFKVED
jgi:hypothetical protein